MTDRLDGAVALVTGASSGIGRATALALAREGATVALVARRAARLRELADAIKAEDAHALVVEADVTEHQQARDAVARVVQEAYRIDVLVNNAGIGYLQPIASSSVSQWRQMVEVNVMGVLHCTHAALPHLTEATAGPRGVADVINISSVAGRIARAGNGVYAATKHAVGAFSESLRQEVAGQSIRVCLVEPGMVHTELTESANENLSSLPASDFEWLHAEDVADAVVYACSRPARAAVNELLLRPTRQER